MDDVIAALREKNVLVTGGAGFVGSRIVGQLLDAGANVRVLDDFSTGLRTNLPDGRPIDVVEGTVQSFDAVRSAMTDQDIVIHAAARNIVRSRHGTLVTTSMSTSAERLTSSLQVASCR